MDDTEAKVLAELERLGIEHRLEPCEPEHADTAVFCEVHGYSVDLAGNAIVVATQKPPKRYACCIVPGTHKLDVNGAVKDKMGARCSFAKPDEMRELTGMEVGGVTPFALPPDLPIWVADALLERPEVIVGTGGRTSKLFIKPRALLQLPNAELVPGLSKPREP